MSWAKNGRRGGAAPGERRGGRKKGSPGNVKPSLKLIAERCDIHDTPPAEEFDALAAMKALARRLMTKVTGQEPSTPAQRVLYDQRITHLVPLLKEIATYQARKKAPEPAPLDDGREEFLQLLAVMVAKHVNSDSARQEIYEVLDAQVRGNVPRLVPPLRQGDEPA